MLLRVLLVPAGLGPHIGGLWILPQKHPRARQYLTHKVLCDGLCRHVCYTTAICRSVIRLFQAMCCTGVGQFSDFFWNRVQIWAHPGTTFRKLSFCSRDCVHLALKFRICRATLRGLVRSFCKALLPLCSGCGRFGACLKWLKCTRFSSYGYS